MRIADKMAFNQIKSNLQRNRSEMAELQNQAATQKRVTKPSDDPVAATRVLAARVDKQGNEQYIKNLNYAKSFLEFSDTSLGELTDLLVRAKELSISQANDAGANKDSRAVTGAEVAQIYDQIVQIANRKLGDRFIFGGYRTTERPFDVSGGYKGDAGEMRIHVDKGSFVSMNLPGSKVFMGENLASSERGIAMEQATNAADLRSQIENEKKHGQDYRYEEDKQDDNIYDDKAETVELRRPATEKATSYSRGPQETTEKNLTEHGINIFSAVKKLEVALKTNDKASIQDSLDTLDESISQVVLSRSQLGSRVSVLNNALNTMHQTNVDINGKISQLEDADAFDVISDITKTESTLKATLETSGRMVQKSLMDFVS